MSATRRIVPLLAALLLLSGGGCALLKPPQDAYWLDPQAPRPGSDAVSLLHYALFVRKLAGRPLAEETERVRVAHSTEKSDFRQLQYAFVLAAPNATTADQRRALQLLEAMIRPGESRDVELQVLASLMRAHLAEQRRLEDGSHSQQRRAEDLEKKLEALKDIEKNLLRPDKGSVPK